MAYRFDPENPFESPTSNDQAGKDRSAPKGLKMEHTFSQAFLRTNLEMLLY